MNGTPDYQSIAAMELDVYGRTFDHAGAPAVSGVPFMPDPDLIADKKLRERVRTAVERWVHPEYAVFERESAPVLRRGRRG